MKYYIKNIKFLIMYLFIISLMSPIIIVGVQFDKFVLLDFISIAMILLIVPFSLATLLYEIFVMDSIEDRDIVSEINDYPKIKYFMIIAFVVIYMITFGLLFSEGEHSPIYTMYLFLIIPMIQQRIILTKDKLYSRLFHINLDEIKQVECMGKNTYRIIMKDGKHVNFAMKNADKVFEFMKEYKVC